MEYTKNDTCFGYVTGKNSSGVYLFLDDGQDAFAYGFTSVPNGCRVWCSVRREATDNRLMLVRIDSTLVERFPEKEAA